MFLSSLAAAYFSSVVMLSSWPSLMGISWSLTVFPVRISGPFCWEGQWCLGNEDFATYGVESNGKGTALLSLLGLTGVVDNGLVVLIRAVREVHADNVETSYCLSACVIFPSGSSIPIPLRSALIFSVELVLGPEKIDISNCPTKKRSRANSKHTNGSDDGGTAEVLGRDHLSVELGVPLQLHTVAEVVERVGGGHFGR